MGTDYTTASTIREELSKVLADILAENLPDDQKKLANQRAVDFWLRGAGPNKVLWTKAMIEMLGALGIQSRFLSGHYQLVVGDMVMDPDYTSPYSSDRKLEDTDEICKMSIDEMLAIMQKNASNPAEYAADMETVNRAVSIVKENNFGLPKKTEHTI